VTLIVCANIDAGRQGAVYAAPWAGLEARLRRLVRGHLPSPLGLIAACLALLTITAAARLAGGDNQTIGAVALAPTVLCLVACAALIDIALSEYSPGAAVNASGVAVAVALTAALDAEPPRHLDVELVIAGAGEGPNLGMAGYVRSRRARRAEDLVVLSVEPCAAGRPRWLTRDGQLFPLRLHPQLVALARQAAAREAHLDARPVAGHGSSSALPARRRRWPALAVGARDELDRVPRAHTASDRPIHVRARAMEATLEFALALVRALDEHLERAPRPPAPKPARGIRSQAMSADPGP
jgi:hypothetical protein